MTITKKITASVLALSMISVSLGGLPFSNKGFTGNFNFSQTVNAAEVEQLSNPIFDRMNALYAALAIDPADMQAIKNMRDELRQLDFEENQHLIDPIWNKMSGKIPVYVDQVKLKASLFGLIKTVGSFQSVADVEAFKSDPEFQATLKMLAAASGTDKSDVNDFLIFLFGDGGSRVGVEGEVGNIIGKMPFTQLFTLLGNSQVATEILLQAVKSQLGEKDAYTFSSILNKLNITSEDIRTTVLNFQNKLQKDDPAINAIIYGYMRMATKASVQESENGRKQTYALKIFTLDIPTLVLKWSKVSGSADVTVASNGVVTIPEGVGSGSAVIRATLVNPYSGWTKTIYEKEVTLKDETFVEENVFPVEQYLQQWSKIRDALVAGGTSDVNNVRKLRDEMLGLSYTKNEALIDPIWNPIANRLPDSVDPTELKKSLLDIIKAVGSLQYDVDSSQVEAIRSNPDFRATLNTIALATGVRTLTVDDILIMMFGDGQDNGGIEGTVRNMLANMSSNELAMLLSNKNGLVTVQGTALAAVLSNKTGYALSEALYNLGVKPDDVASMELKFKSKLKYDESAIKAMSAAYVRSEMESTVKVTQNGRQHEYGVTVLGVELPSSSLKWKKVSGSKDVKVDSKGEVTISNKVEKGTALIQASLVKFLGSSSKVIFEQEVTLVNDDFGKDPAAEMQKIVKTFESTVTDLKQRLAVATIDSEKVQILVEIVQAGNDSYDQISPIEVTKTVKTKAINNIKKQVTQMTNLIIESLLKF